MKQQVDIAQKRVELDIRDRRYEVFKRWNEAYFVFRDHIYTNTPDCQFIDVSNVFLSTSVEVFYIFINNLFINKIIRTITERVKNIKRYRGDWTKYANICVDDEFPYRCGDSPSKLCIEPRSDFNQFEWGSMQEYYDKQIYKTLQVITKQKEALTSLVLQQMEIS